MRYVKWVVPFIVLFLSMEGCSLQPLHSFRSGTGQNREIKQMKPSETATHIGVNIKPVTITKSFKEMSQAELLRISRTLYDHTDQLLLTNNENDFNTILNLCFWDDSYTEPLKKGNYRPNQYIMVQTKKSHEQIKVNGDNIYTYELDYNTRVTTAKGTTKELEKGHDVLVMSQINGIVKILTVH